MNILLQQLSTKLKVVIFALETIEKLVLISSFLVIIFAVALQVICRYFFNNPLSWPEELSRFLLVWLSFLATAILYRRKGHISVSTVVDLLSERNKSLVSLVLNSTILAFLLCIIIAGIELHGLQTNMTTMASLEIPKCYLTLALTTSALSMVLTGIWFVIEDCLKLFFNGV